MNTAHAVLSAATAATPIVLALVGTWLQAILRSNPQPAFSEMPRSLYVLSATAGCLLLVAFVALLPLVSLSLVRIVHLRHESSTERLLFALRVVMVVLAWVAICFDPTGGLAWVLE